MGLKPARNSFIGAKDLEGCLVIIQGLEAGTSPSTVPGAPQGSTYDWVRATVAVLDGDVSDAVREQVGHGELPIVLEDIRFDKGAIVNELKPKVGAFDGDGTPKLTVGRIGTYTDKYRNPGRLRLDEPDEADFGRAVKYMEGPGAETFPEKDPFASGAAKAFA